jgi:glycosyltransferase involved in cell wall biosynthesis
MRLNVPPYHKVLILCLSKHGFGGLELQMAHKTREWIERGNSALLVVIEDSPLHRYVVDKQIPHRAIRQRVEYVDLITAGVLSGIIREFKPSFCLVGITRDLSIALLARMLTVGLKNPPRIILYQQMISGLKKRDLFHNWVYRNIDGAIVPAQYMHTMLLETTCIAPDKVKTIPYGISVEHFRLPTQDERISARKLYGFDEDDIVCCIPARFDPLKNQQMCIDAMAIIAKETTNQSILLWCVDNPSTDPDSYYMRMQRYVTELGLQKRVRFSGFTDDFRSILFASDIYLMTSRIETFSLAVVQAQATGICSIGTATGGTPEQIIHEETGLLVESDNAKELASAILRIVSDSKLRERLSQCSREVAVQRYDADVVYNHIAAMGLTDTQANG